MTMLAITVNPFAMPQSRTKLRAALAAILVAAALLAAPSGTQSGSAVVHAEDDVPNPLSVRITSPLGRLGLPGTIRIVAQVRIRRRSLSTRSGST